MKDGSTHFAYKAEQAVDLDTGAIVAVTTHGGATGDTTSMETTLPEAGWAIANQIDTATEKGQYKVDERGLQEVVTDKGYHSNSSLQSMAEAGVRSYVPAPKQKRNWDGKPSEKALYVGNQRRVTGEQGKQLLKRRGEFLERPFAHQYERWSASSACAGIEECRQAGTATGGSLQSGADHEVNHESGNIARDGGEPTGAIAAIFAIYSILKGRNMCV